MTKNGRGAMSHTEASGDASLPRAARQFTLCLPTARCAAIHLVPPYRRVFDSSPSGGRCHGRSPRPKGLASRREAMTDEGERRTGADAGLVANNVLSPSSPTSVATLVGASPAGGSIFPSSPPVLRHWWGPFGPLLPAKPAPGSFCCGRSPRWGKHFFSAGGSPRRRPLSSPPGGTRAPKRTH